MSKNLIAYKPRVLVIGLEEATKQSKAEKKHIELTYDYNLQSWMHLLDADYACFRSASETMISRYDIIICTSLVLLDERWSARIAQIAALKLRHVKWVTVFEGMIDLYHKVLANLKRMLDASDLVNVVNLSMLSAIASITERKCESLGHPYPILNISRFRTELPLREKMLFICPPLLKASSEAQIVSNLDLPAIGFERKTPKGLLPMLADIGAYKKTADKLPEIRSGGLGRFFARNKFMDLAKAKYGNPRMIINPQLPPEKHYRLYSRYFAWISTAGGADSDQHVLTAATLGVPIITTKASNLGSELFPYTCLRSDTAFEEAVDIVANLLHDRDYYKQVCDFPASLLEHFRGVNQKIRLLQLLNYRA